MYNFSGILYRIWGVCGLILLLGLVCILFEKPWAKSFTIRDCKIGLILIAFSVSLGIVYMSRIVSTDISSYTGEFIGYQRNSRVAPPLPVTYEYLFDNGEEKQPVFYLDIFSKDKIFPSEFEEGKEYTIYFDGLTNIIVKVENIK